MVTYPIVVSAFAPCQWRSPASAASCLAAEAVEIVVTVTGLDETISQAVHARTSYLAHEVLWGHRFSDVFTQTKDGRLATPMLGFDRRQRLRCVQGFKPWATHCGTAIWSAWCRFASPP